MPLKGRLTTKRSYSNFSDRKFLNPGRQTGRSDVWKSGGKGSRRKLNVRGPFETLTA